MTEIESTRTDTASGQMSVSDRYWVVVCLALVLPIAAIGHNVVFFRTTCMLNPFGEWGNDYTSLKLLHMWLIRDPALWAGLGLAHVAYHAGLRRPLVRLLLAAFFVAFLPITVWVWDVPFTERAVCLAFHDGRLEFGGFQVSGTNIYFFCIALYGVLLVILRGRIKAAWARA